ncbi:MAG: DUF6050 family protein [Clostridiales bacterium]|nr:DUF6050 family protein [Clostridiales bacterium]
MRSSGESTSPPGRRTRKGSPGSKPWAPIIRNKPLSPGSPEAPALPLFLLNFIIGGVIGGFVLTWRLLVAAWYIP